MEKTHSKSPLVPVLFENIFEKVENRIIIAVTITMVAATVLLSLILEFPIVAPSGQAMKFINFHYIIPVATIAMWSYISFRNKNGNNFYFNILSLISYAIVMICHFNVKLWMGHINEKRYDEIFWESDNYFRTIVDFCIFLREFFNPYNANIDSLYLILFVFMFYVSFIYHALKTPETFKRVAIASIIVQGAGAFSYAAFPALGPFLYEAGANAAANMHQAHMLTIYKSSMAGQSEWLAISGSENLLAGLAAMPSLHTAASAVFIWYAFKTSRILFWLYVPLFLFILVEAIATRWHYFIDLPAGLILASISIIATEYCLKSAKKPVPEVPITARLAV